MRVPSETAIDEEGQARTVDVLVPDGCPLCDGPMHLRFTPESAWSLCKRCEYLTAPVVRPNASGRYELLFRPGVEV